MTLKEFDMTRPFLKDDANIEIKIKKTYNINKSITAKPKAKTNTKKVATAAKTVAKTAEKVTKVENVETKE